MSYSYLFDMYAYIDQRLAKARRQLIDTGQDPQGKQFAAGRIEALSQFKRFLSDHYDAHLPGRLARRRTSSGNNRTSGP